MRVWAVEVRSEDHVRPHRLDERVLTSLAEALDADSRAFDSDVVGDGESLYARFDLWAEDESAARSEASAIFLAALSHAGASELTASVSPHIRAREHLRN